MPDPSSTGRFGCSTLPPMRAAVSAAMFLAILPSCTNDTMKNDSVTIADSAGITVVTNWDAPEGLAHWRTESILTIGQLDGPEEYSFGQIADVEVDSRGRVIVLDRQAQRGMVYGPDGEFLFRFGGAGEGPGEFSDHLMSVQVAACDSIAVLDSWLMRLTIFDRDGSMVRTYPMHVGRQGPYQFHMVDGVTRDELDVERVSMLRVVR